MENYNIYEDIATRTQGALYIGVVGPVRTGKSTFIKRFLEKLVLPVAEEGNRTQMQDEMPQSSGGKTIMTTEPKFVPASPVAIQAGKTTAKIRLIDCVGFPVAGAMGMEEDGAERLVNTPWSDTPLPFTEAAKTGTEKVIRDHSTVAFLVTTDGSITDLPRESYLPAEENTVAELKKLQKPFVVLLNCRHPESTESALLRTSLEEKYSCRVIAVNVEEAGEPELLDLLKDLLFEFPVTGIDVNVPDWLRTLPADDPLISSIAASLRSVAPKIEKMKDCSLLEEAFADNPAVQGVESLGLNLSEGRAECSLSIGEGVYYQVVTSVSGEPIGDECSLLRYVRTLSKSKKNFDSVSDAFRSAQECGYGVVSPIDGEIQLEEPKLIRQGQNVGLHLTATAPTYHILKVDVTASVDPVVGSGKGSEEFVNGLLEEYGTDEDKLWKTELFGKSLRELVDGGLTQKSGGMPEPLQRKMRKALSKIVNDGRGNILCILL
jgi:stage IV sporulation protein A